MVEQQKCSNCGETVNGTCSIFPVNTGPRTNVMTVINYKGKTLYQGCLECLAKKLGVNTQ